MTKTLIEAYTNAVTAIDRRDAEGFAMTEIYKQNEKSSDRHKFFKLKQL